MQRGLHERTAARRAAGHKDVLHGKTVKCVAVDWRSRKLQRVSRSSLVSEAQAAAAGADAQEYVK
eukprot:4253700-Pyramimonas_sp.AAC.1